MANQQPDHDRIIEILSGAQAHLRQSFINLLEAGATIESLSAFYDAARSLEIAGNAVGDDEDDDQETEETTEEIIKEVVAETLDPIAAQLQDLGDRIAKLLH
jgi:hypothetical protein